MPRGSSTCSEARQLLAGALLALLIAIAPSAVAAQDAAMEDELLLFAVRLENVDLTDAAAVYQRDRQLYFPLGELSRLVGLAVEVDGESGTADGFLVRPSRTFHVDVADRTVTIEGVTATFPEGAVDQRDEDLYVRQDLLTAWLPFSIRVDRLGSRIFIEPREPLPIQLRRDRELRIRRALRGDEEIDDPLPLMPSPYSLFDGPFIDQTLRFTSTSRRSADVQFASYLTADLFYMQADAYLSGTLTDPGAETRVTLSRRDPLGRLLGPLRAREAAVGEVFVPGDDLLLNAASGTGLVLSNYPLVRPTQFGRHTFRGNLPPDWDVELYQNGALIRYQRSRADGLYEFLDIPLVFGLNEFRLVFHGPHGEVREELHAFNIADALPSPGTTWYRIAGNEDRIGQQRISAEVEYGLHENFAVSAALARQDVLLVQGTAGRVGIGGYWRNLFVRSDVARDDDGGSALRNFVQTRLGTVDLTLQHALLRDFETDVFRPLYGRVENDLIIRGDALLRRGEAYVFPIQLALHHQQFESGGSLLELQQRVSAQLGGTFLSNQLTGSTLNTGDDAPSLSSFRGSLLGSRHMRLLGMRGEMTYGVSPDPRLETLTMLAETLRFPGYLLQAGVRHGFAGGDTTLLVNVNRTEGSFAGGISASYSEAGGYSLSVNLFSGLARDPRTGRWSASARPVAAGGAASARVFVDRNANLLFDREDQLVEGAGFFVDRVSHRAVTDENGIALLTGLPPLQPHRVELSTADLEDPFWVPAVPAVRFIPRPGKSQVIDFPLLATGEITGTAYYETAERTRPAAGLQLELVAGDEVAAATRAAYDGFYQFTKIRPGVYSIRVNPAQAARLGALEQPPLTVTIEPDGSIRDGVDLVVRRGDPAAVQPSPRVSGRLTLCADGVRVPAAGVTIFLLSATASVEATTAADGSFTFEELSSAPAVLLFARETLPAALRAADLPRIVVTPAPGGAPVEIDLPCE